MTNEEKHQWLLTKLLVHGASEPPEPIVLELDGTQPFEWPDPVKYKLDGGVGEPLSPPTFCDDEVVFVLTPYRWIDGLHWIVEDATPWHLT